jgi:predicted nucleic acid-binding protein
MYLIGAEHPNKARASALVARYSNLGTKMTTDAEVYQEILHRLRSINRLNYVQLAFDILDDLVEDVLPVGRSEIEAGKSALLAYPHLSARDAIHVGVMNLAGIREIMTFDSGFESVRGLTRIH